MRLKIKLIKQCNLLNKSELLTIKDNKIHKKYDTLF